MIFWDFVNKNYGSITTILSLLITTFMLWQAVRPSILKYKYIKNKEKQKLANNQINFILKIYSNGGPLKTEDVLNLLTFLSDKTIKKIINKEEWIYEALLEIRRLKFKKTKLLTEDIQKLFISNK